ncbi:MAG: Rrf2 family transcriptional regulator [Clostridia bacterium]|nr:Rrf2 family transcriptional regulator [Clostridia bacterium]
MKLSTKGKYGLYAMIFLAQRQGEGPQSLKAFGELNLPEAYLEQLLGSLRRAGLVNTVRGTQGGYFLSREPERVTVKEILEAMEGPLRFSDCVAEPEQPCARSGTCPARGVWEYLTGEINALLNRITLSDIVSHNLRNVMEDTQ